MANSGLAELGRELCHQFDERQAQLKDLQVETVSGIKEHRYQARQQEQADRAERRAECRRLKSNITELLGQYWTERQKSWKEWREDCTAQRNEFQAWKREWGADVKSWNEAVRYVRTKRSRG